MTFQGSQEFFQKHTPFSKMADADARMKALEKELLKELEKVRSLKDETLKALALDFTKMGEVQRILDSIKKATAVLGFREDKPGRSFYKKEHDQLLCCVVLPPPVVYSALPFQIYGLYLSLSHRYETHP